MNRLARLVALSALLVGVCFAQSVAPRPAEEPDTAYFPPPTPRPDRARVVVVDDPSLVSRFRADPARTQQAFNLALLTLTRKGNVRDAWLSLVNPSDRIGLKISTGGAGSYGSTPAIIESILAGLRQAGVPMNHVIVWDRTPTTMAAAGFPTGLTRGGWRNMAVFPGAGFDSKVFYFNEIVGQLIWGDLEFQGRSLDVGAMMDAADPSRVKDRAGLPNRPGLPAATQVSNRSHFTTIVTQQITKIINVAAMSDHAEVGVHGCLSSLALSAVDNQRRFTSPSNAGDPGIAEILDHDALRGKVALNVMDGLIAQFAGGPTFRPNYAQPAGLIFLSLDPVAIDTLALQRLEQWRLDRKVVPIGSLARHIRSCGGYGIGIHQRERIDVITLRAP